MVRQFWLMKGNPVPFVVLLPPACIQLWDTYMQKLDEMNTMYYQVWTKGTAFKADPDKRDSYSKVEWSMVRALGKEEQGLIYKVLEPMQESMRGMKLEKEQMAPTGDSVENTIPENKRKERKLSAKERAQL